MPFGSAALCGHASEWLSTMTSDMTELADITSAGFPAVTSTNSRWLSSPWFSSQLQLPLEFSGLVSFGDLINGFSHFSTRANSIVTTREALHALRQLYKKHSLCLFEIVCKLRTTQEQR